MRPPEGAPNIVLILLDDVGFGQFSVFGGGVSSPNMEKLAAQGLRYNRFHTTALCSPTRAALLTGRNHHVTGNGSITEAATGYDGYTGIIPKSTGTVAEILRQNGYATAWVGKNHNTPVWETSEIGPFDRWANGLGFDYFYGFNSGDTSQYEPILYENRNRVPRSNDPNYHLSTDIADKSIAWMQKVKAIDPERPFFLYVAPGATHSPHQAPKEWIDKFKGQFDMGWDRYREMTFERQKQLGVIPANAKLTPRPAGLPAWDSLNADQKRLYARMMEVFAGYGAHVDHEIGRVLDAVAKLPDADNTLIIYIVGDNGASAEGGPEGSTNENAFFNSILETLAGQPQGHRRARRPEALQSLPVGLGLGNEYAVPVDEAGRFAFRRHAQSDDRLLAGEDHRQGRAAQPVPPRHRHHADAAGGGRRAGAGCSQRRAAEADRGRQPDLHVRRRQGGRPPQGSRSSRWASIAACTRTAGLPPRCPSFHGSRSAPASTSIRRSGSFTTSSRTSRRPTTSRATNPEKLRALQDLWWAEAARNDILPLDWRGPERFSVELTGKPSLAAGRKTFVYETPLAALPEAAAPDLKNKSFTITAEAEIPAGGADGMIFTQGGFTGGWGFYIQQGKLVGLHNHVALERYRVVSTEPVPTGKVTLAMDFKYDGDGTAKGGTITLLANGRKIGEGRVEKTTPFKYALAEGQDIGEDTGSPIDFSYTPPFKFTGKLGKVTVELK